MWVIAKICPYCKEQLTFEAIGSYGDLYKINKRNGKVTKKRMRRVHYEHSGDFMVYCSKCGRNYDYRRDQEGRIYITYYKEY